MRNSHVLFGVALFWASFVSLPVAVGKSCPDTSDKSELFFVDENGNSQLLPKLSNGKYKLDGDLFDGGRRLRFFGKIKQSDPDDDFMVVIKLRGNSEKEQKDTKFVRLHRDSMNGDRGFDDKKFPLEQYSKHHFPDENDGADNSVLKNKFHTPYIVGGVKQYTDGDSEKKRLFQFDGVGNTWPGGLLARLFKPSNAYAATSKYVYLQAEIQNLKTSPCFEFQTYVPRSVDDLLIQVLPIDAKQRSNLLPNGKQWQLKSEGQ